MQLVKMISNVFNATVCIISFAYTSYCLYNLMHFLSGHNEKQRLIPETKTDENAILLTIWSLLVDFTLLCAFMFEHSFMTSDITRHVYRKLHIDVMERSIYNICSAGALHILINYWEPIPWISIWDVATSRNSICWIIFTGFHVFGWSIIYGGCLVMDLSELSGLKQVYYKISSRPCPMAMKSKELQRFYMHMRHPSFTGILIILWIYPFMTIDRVLLASMLTVYMLLMWAIDEDDYNYQATAVRYKQRVL